MPTETFFNLPEPKRQRIYAAAVQEFATYRLSQASINRIVKAANISRGSFYQYFHHKEDLYCYILEQVSHEKRLIYSKYQPQGSDVGFFEALLASLPAILEWAEQRPDYNRIGMLFAQEDIATQMRLAGQMVESQAGWEMVARDQQAGRIRPEVDPKLVVEMISLCSAAWLRDYYTSGMQQQTTERMKAALDIISHGVSLPKPQ